MAIARFVAVVLLMTVLLSITGGVALGVVGGKSALITTTPWTVVVLEQSPYAGQPRYEACTGVIIGPRKILTAGHCVMSGNSAKLLPVSDFTIEAGVSNFNHPLASDHRQFRAVNSVRAMPGYIATSRWTSGNLVDASAHDLAVFTLSRALELNGEDARAADLPGTSTRQPSAATRLVMAGYGREKAGVYSNGTLNEVAKSTVWRSCSTSGALCVFSTTGPCLGDSGSGLVERGSDPTVIGILSNIQTDCRPGLGYYVSLTAPAALRFIGTGG